MASATPKLAQAVSRDDVARWLAETIQEKAGKENAGLVEIALTPSGRNATAPSLRITTNRGARDYTITVG